MDIRDVIYPNGELYRAIFIKQERIGNYAVRPNGFLPWGGRKVLQDEKEAQFRVIQKYIAKHLKLATEAAKLYQEL